MRPSAQPFGSKMEVVLQGLRDTDCAPALVGRTLGEESGIEVTMVKSKRDLESEISQAIIRFEKEFMGRGPLETKTYLLDDLVVVRLKGVLTTAEIKLAELQQGGRGRYLL